MFVGVIIFWSYSNRFSVILIRSNYLASLKTHFDFIMVFLSIYFTILKLLPQAFEQIIFDFDSLICVSKKEARFRFRLDLD